MMKFSLGGRIPAVLGLAMALAAPLHAAVTNAAWYRLGESDPGAASGGISFGSQNSSGVNHLTSFGLPRYTNAVSTTAALAVDSSLALSFDGISQYLSNAVFTPQTFNFGVEAWVRPASINPGTYYIASYGHPDFGGWSLARVGNQYRVYYGISPVMTGGIATPGVWTHVALVRDSFVGTLYVDGVAVGSTTDFANGSAGSFTVGARAAVPATDFFAGEIDEVRIFNFEPGQFSTNDLLLNQKNVRTLAATSVTVSNATLNGSVYSRDSQPFPVNVWFEWGPAPVFGNSSPLQFLGMGAVSTNFSLAITGLQQGVTYQFRALANIGGNLLVGSNRFFTTPSPRVVTLPATLPATLNGSVNPGGTNTAAWFEWGTTTNYGNVTSPQAVGAGTNFTAYSEVLSGLVAGTTYHFRAVASNVFAMAFGTNQSFYAPPFTLAVTNLPALIYSSTAWGDYDNDGRLDLLITGQGTNTSIPISQVWRNTGNGFTNATASVAPDLPGVQYSAVAWGDYDNDGWLDFLLTGRITNSVFISQLWRNTGSRFTNVTASLAPGLPRLAGGSVAWADFDNDGRLDFLLTGNNTNGNAISQLWRNTGNGFTNATSSFAPDLPGVSESSVGWGDYDNDGRLDLLLTGFNIAQLWRNFGSRLINVTTTVAPELGGGNNNCVAWGDYDNDGRLDFIRSGGTLDFSGTELYRNTGNGFTNAATFLQPLAGLPPMLRASLAWGDYDNDGLQDVLISGSSSNSSASYIVRVLRNTGNGFTNVNIPGLAGVDYGNATWGDYDGDGRLDFLFNGYNTSIVRVSQLWRSHTAISNTPPAAPTGLSVNATGLVATLSWNAPFDAQTPAGGMSYNVRIGTVPGGSDILRPAAAFSGMLRVPQMGNAQEGLTATFNYTLGTAYYWSVQGVDGGFVGSPFSAEGNFKILSPAASVVQAQATNQPAGDTNGDGLVSQAELDAVLASYWPQAPWLFMTNVVGLGGTNVTFALSNSTAGSFTVEYTTNLVDWELLGPAIPRYLFTDTNAPVAPQRSYRLRFP
jgi:hypothetical protein